MTIRIRKRGQAEWLLSYVLLVGMLQGGLIDFLHIPSVIKYTIDLAWIFVVILMRAKQIVLVNKDIYLLYVIAGLFFIFSLFGFALNYQSALYYLWGLRNNIRFFVFFIACTVVLNEEWIEGYLDTFDKLFWLNFPIVLYQYFIGGNHGDKLGGIFGETKGCNAYMNIFLIIVLSKSILGYLHKKEKLSLCILKCLIGLTIAVLSELKVVIVEFVIIVAMASMMMRFSMRKLLLMIGAFLGILLSVRAISVLFPSFDGWFSINGILEILTSESGYTGQNDLNRLTAVPVVLERFLPHLMDKIVGLGLGNCDYATFDFLQTPFYQSHKSIHYYWFSSAFLLLETGLLGFALFLIFFLTSFLTTHLREKTGQSNVVYCQMAKIMAMTSIITVFYNAALRTEAGYMAFFILALPFTQKNKVTEIHPKKLSTEGMISNE